MSARKLLQVWTPHQVSKDVLMVLRTATRGNGSFTAEINTMDFAERVGEVPCLGIVSKANAQGARLSAADKLALVLIDRSLRTVGGEEHGCLYFQNRDRGHISVDRNLEFSQVPAEELPGIMSIELRDIHYGALKGVTAWAPNGAIIGVVGEKGSGTSDLLRLMAGVAEPDSGQVLGPDSRRYVAESEPVSPAPVDVLAIDHALGKYDALVRARTLVGLDRLRKAGSTVVIASNEEELLERVCDEIWWVHNGVVAAKGDPRDTLRKYRAHIGQKFQAWSESLKIRLNPTDRRGDQRAQIQSLQLLNSRNVPTLVWQSGEEVSIELAVEFAAAVANPIVGILIRTRIGFEAYGTNTALEGVKLGSTSPGQVRKVGFQFRCDLCPGEYTLTATSQDPSGAIHDWIEDALSFTVTDVRATPGVVNLRARVTAE